MVLLKVIKKSNNNGNPSTPDESDEKKIHASTQHILYYIVKYSIEPKGIKKKKNRRSPTIKNCG